MSNTPSTDGFVWTDEKIIEFIRFINQRERDFKGYYSDIADFKAQASHTYSGVDWEVVAYFTEMAGGTVLDKNEDGSFGPFAAKESDLKASSLFSIHSVRRLSDGEVFTIGDDSPKGKIKEFKLPHPEGQIYVWYDLGGFCYLHECKKAPIPEQKKPLLKTIDGVDKFEGDLVWRIAKDLSDSHNPRQVDVNPDHIYPDRLYFDKLAGMDEYILLNKPVLSVIEVLAISKIEMETFGQFTVQRLKQIAKSKINNKEGDTK